MIAIDYALALAIIASPGDDAIDDHRSLAPIIQSLAIQLEIIDPREVRYVLTRTDDFTADVKLLRRRWQDLHDAPPLRDCWRFPDRPAINDLLSFNRSYRQHLDGQRILELTYWWELREAMAETERLYQIWDTARDASCDYYYVSVRRQALKKLRDTIGTEAYHSGWLPSPVPIGRFRRMD